MRQIGEYSEDGHLVRVFQPGYAIGCVRSQFSNLFPTVNTFERRFSKHKKKVGNGIVEKQTPQLYF